MDAEAIFSIPRLVNSYAECFERAGFASLAEFFADAACHKPPAVRRKDVNGLRRLWEGGLRVESETGVSGELRLITISASSQMGCARARSIITVLEAAANFALQPTIFVTSNNRFRKIDGRQQCIERVAGNGLAGVLSAHLLNSSN